VAAAQPVLYNILTQTLLQFRLKNRPIRFEGRKPKPFIEMATTNVCVLGAGGFPYKLY
jgi:hypothetical protein